MAVFGPLRVSASRCRQSSLPWSSAQRRHPPRNASGQSAASAFSHDDVMTRRERDLEATLTVCREGLNRGIAGFDQKLHVMHWRNSGPVFRDRSRAAGRDENCAFDPARSWSWCFCHRCHGEERQERRSENRNVRVRHLFNIAPQPEKYERIIRPGRDRIRRPAIFRHDACR